MEQSVADRGHWDAVTFLLTCRLLRQRDYAAWCSGQITALEAAIDADPRWLDALLTTAMRYAEQQLKLTSIETTWRPWGDTDGDPLRLFHNDAQNQRFQKRLAPRRNRRQLDLFLDTPRTILLNRLRSAVRNRSADYHRLMRRARAELGNAPALTRLEAIHDALENETVADPIRWLERLMRVVIPAAKEEFPTGEYDVASPLWRAAAAAMVDLPFDPAHPEYHASYPLLQARDWEECLAAVDRVADWTAYPPLHHRRITALSAMGDHQAAREGWMLFCWLHPDAAASALATTDLRPDGLHGVWRQFTQLESACGEDAIAISDFPALIALRYPLQTEPPLFAHAGGTIGWRHYQLLNRLSAAEQRGAPDIALRQSLKQNSPGLLRAFLKQIPRPH